MKKNRFLILSGLILAAVALWLYFSQNSGTIRKELRDFAVKDTASVTKLFLANKSGMKVLLERKDNGEWTLDNKYNARPDAVKMMLSTLHDMEVRSPVAKAAYNNIIKDIAAAGIKVEIYDAQGLTKTLYVGGPTQDQLGTFMYLENSTVPFIIHIPGFDGYLTPRFIVNPADWIEKSVFRLREGNLKKLFVTDQEIPGATFTIYGAPGADFTMTDVNGREVEHLSQDKVRNYLDYYRLLNYEDSETSLSQMEKDSLLATTPFRTIDLTEQSGKNTRIELWRRPITESTLHKGYDDGTPFPHDMDRMTASVNSDTSLVIVQYFSFEKLFRKPSDFQQFDTKIQGGGLMK